VKGLADSSGVLGIGEHCPVGIDEHPGGQSGQRLYGVGVRGRLVLPDLGNRLHECLADRRSSTEVLGRGEHTTARRAPEVDLRLG
jgi:hypothetical protein